MRSWVQLSLFVAMTALFAVGCGDDDAQAIRLGDEGESCVRTGDCKSGLSCVNNFCAQQGSSGTGGDADGGAGTGGSTGPALGGEGESCQARRDCQEGLQCIEQRCASGGSAGSGGAPAPRLGARGESCEVPSDCAEGLTCIRRANVSGGVCDLEDFGLEPTGNVCTGECLQATDCCQLPLGLGYPSCEALEETGLAGNVAANCPVTGPAAGYETACFYYRTYCQCAGNTWACTNNRCSYNVDCSVSAATWDGCPNLSRAGFALVSTCSTDDRCESAPACNDDVDCAAPADRPFVSCDGQACTCYQSTCYLKCNEDLDCQFGFTCDEADEVCKPVPGCTTNEQCAASTGDAIAECREGACVIPCSIDQDCADSGVRGGGTIFNAMVCNADNICETLGCSTDDDCMSNGVRMFCVEPIAGAAGGARSAITD